MPTKEQLLTEHRAERDRERQRAILCAQVIAALPDGVEVRKAYTSTAHLNGRSPMQGIYEFERETYVSLHELLEALPACKTVRVGMFDGGGHKTTSFYPKDRVPEFWHEEHEVVHVEGYIWEARASRLQSEEARVSVEWYTEPRAGLFVLCRATIKCHGAHYRAYVRVRGGLTPWKLYSAPSGAARCIGSRGERLAVTIYWYAGSFGDVGQFVDHLTGGPTQNV